MQIALEEGIFSITALHPRPLHAICIHIFLCVSHKLQINGCVSPRAELLFKYWLGGLNASQVRTQGHPIKLQICCTWLTIHFVIFTLPFFNHFQMTFKIKPEEKNKFPEVKQSSRQSSAQHSVIHFPLSLVKPCKRAPVVSGEPTVV